MDWLLETVVRGGAREALRFGARDLSYRDLRAAALGVAGQLAGIERVALWATPELETCVGLVGALLAGAAVVPLNPRSGARELVHVLGDSAPSALLAPHGAPLPAPLAGLPRLAVALPAAPTATPTSSPEPRAAAPAPAIPPPAPAGAPAPAAPPLPPEPPAAAPAPAAPPLPPEPPAGAPALIVYTSGTTGPPKGAVLSRGALAANLDALADAWAWTEADVLAHALPLFHVHGLVLGLLGPLRRGGTLRHLGRFSPAGARDAFEAGATMLFGVPTMYHRLAQTLPEDARLARALARARVLVSVLGAARAGRRSRDRARERAARAGALWADGDADPDRRACGQRPRRLARGRPARGRAWRDAIGRRRPGRARHGRAAAARRRAAARR